MSDQSSTLGRYLKRKAALKVVAKIGKAKLLAAGAAVAGGFLVFLVLLAAIVGAASSTDAQGATSCKTSGGTDSPPARLVPIYVEASEKYGLGPRGPGILAAINKVESDFGRSELPGVHSGTNSAGAAGPMQFLYPSSWDPYGVDGDGDGEKDVYNPTDAIFAAANLLQSLGAPKDWYGAIFGYNHADWYVREVEQIAESYGAVECTTELGSLPSPPVQRLVYIAKWIEAKKLPYCWGGGHGAKPGPSGGISYCWNAEGDQVFGSTAQGLDCSGAVRWLLVLAGYPDPGGDVASGGYSNPYPGDAESAEPIWAQGSGAHVTIWSNAEHVFIELDGSDWGTSLSNYAHGPGFADHTTAGFVASHPAGL
jgi:hypothetical protein